MSDVYELPTVTGNFTQPIPVKAGVVILAGALFGIDSSGRAVPADDATAATIAGRATTEADNSASGAADGDVSVVAERAAYVVENSATGALTAADLLQDCYLEGPSIVRRDQTGSEPVAGKFLGFDGDQVVVKIG